MIEISKHLTIPEKEIVFIFSRSSGPGGQNVNKLSTKATLLFNVRASPSLSEAQKDAVQRRLAARISKNGILMVVSMRYRTQKANRNDALQRFIELLRTAFVEKPPRKKTTVSRAARERRVRNKKQRSRVKQTRRTPAAE